MRLIECQNLDSNPGKVSRVKTKQRPKAAGTEDAVKSFEVGDGDNA